MSNTAALGESIRNSPVICPRSALRPSIALPTSTSERPERFDLVINLKTATAIGADVPAHLQQLADEIIE
jgi:hypothetical protein